MERLEECQWCREEIEYDSVFVSNKKRFTCRRQSWRTVDLSPIIFISEFYVSERTTYALFVVSYDDSAANFKMKKKQRFTYYDGLLLTQSSPVWL